MNNIIFYKKQVNNKNGDIRIIFIDDNHIYIQVYQECNAAKQYELISWQRASMNTILDNTYDYNHSMLTNISYNDFDNINFIYSSNDYNPHNLNDIAELNILEYLAYRRNNNLETILNIN